MSPPTRRSRGGDPGSDTIAHRIAGTTTSNSNPSPRLAVDGVEQLREAERWLDSLDVVVMSAQSRIGPYTAQEALEYTLAVTGHVRRAVQLAVAA